MPPKVVPVKRKWQYRSIIIGIPPIALKLKYHKGLATSKL